MAGESPLRSQVSARNGEPMAECVAEWHRHAARRPDRLVFDSLAQLFELYEGLFLQGHEYRGTLNSSCGLEVTAFDRCFPHLVKLTRHGQQAGVPFNIQEEKPRIRSQLNGFGPYGLDEYRARHLPSALDTLLDPSVDGSNPAICGHRKSGHFGRPETAPEFYFKGSCTRKDV